MANVWDLIVRLAGDGSKLREDIDQDIGKIEELHASIKDKSFKVDAHVKSAEDDIYALQLEIQALTDKTMQISADTAEAQAPLEDLKTKSDELRNLAMKVWVEPKDKEKTTHDLGDLSKKAEEFRLALAAIPVDVLASEAKRQIEEIKTELRDLHGKTITVDVVEEKTGNGAGVVAQGAKDQKGKGGAFTWLGPTIASLLPAAGPIGGAAVGGIGGLASALAPGMAGGAGFGALATTEIAPVISAKTQLKAAQLQYNNAVTNAQKLQALKAEQSALANLDAEQRKALQTTQQFVGEWDQYRKQFEPQIVTAFTDALQLLMSFMKSLAPAIKGFATAFITLEQDASKALTSPFWKSFFGYLGGEAKQSTMAFGIGLGNLAKGFAGLLMAFNPLAQTMDKGWISMTASFAKWATHLGATKGFKNFLNDVNKDGPLTLNVIGQLILLVNNLLRGMEPIGRVLLTAVDGILHLANGLTSLNPLVTQFAAAALETWGISRLLKPLGGLGTGITKFIPVLAKLADKGGLIGLFAGGLTRLTPIFQTVGKGLTALGGPWGILFAAIVAGVILIIANWNKIKHWWIEFEHWIPGVWRGFINGFKGMWDGMMRVLHMDARTVTEAFNTLWNQIKRGWLDFEHWVTGVWRGFITSFKGMWSGMVRVLHMDAKTVIQAFIALWTEISRLFTGWVKQAERFGASIVGGIVSGIENAFNSAKQGLMAAWHDVTSLFTGGPSLSVSSGTAAMVHGSTSTIHVVHSGSVKVDGLTPKAVQQVNQHLYNSAMRKR